MNCEMNGIECFDELTELVRLIVTSIFSEFELERCVWHDGVTIPPNHPDSAENL